MIKWAVFAATVFAGCASAPQQHPYIARFDGKQIDSVTLEQTTVECASRAKVAEAAVPYAYAGQITSSVSRTIEQSATNSAAFQGCMAEKGMRVTWGPPPSPAPITTGSIPQQK